jgi:hypothetical protein
LFSSSAKSEVRSQKFVAGDPAMRLLCGAIPPGQSPIIR